MKETILEACEESRQRMNKYTPEQRKALAEKALEAMFPNGHWKCSGDAHPQSVICVGNGEDCPICKTGQPSARRDDE